MQNLYKEVDFVSWYYLNKDLKTTEGEILDVFATDIYEVIDEEEYQIEGFEYFYIVDGKKYRWISYSYLDLYYPGDKIQLEYNPEKPEFSKIKGMINSPSDEYFLFWLFVFLLFSFLLIKNLRKGYKEYLEYKTWEIVPLKRMNCFRKNKRDHIRDYRFTFEYTINEHKCLYVIDTIHFDKYAKKSEQNFFIVCNPEKPNLERKLIDNFSIVTSYFLKKENNL
ncbi:DUF3592 domain-containing protein [Aureivirga marina]